MDSPSTEIVTSPGAYTPSKPPAPNKGVRHLRAYEVADILRWTAEGLTQEQIGQRLTPQRPQKTVSDVLSRFGTDYTNEAKRILRGGAADMALNILRTGQAKDHVQALKGLGVLEEQQQQGLTVLVGSGGQVNIGVLVSPPSSAAVLPSGGER